MTDRTECPDCEGEGRAYQQVWAGDESGQEDVGTCPTCDGTGLAPGQKVEREIPDEAIEAAAEARTPEAHTCHADCPCHEGKEPMSDFICEGD